MNNRRVKILLITNDFPPCFSGGISNFYFNLCKRRENNHVKIIAPFCKGSIEFDRNEKLITKRAKVPIRRSFMGRVLQMAILLFQSFQELRKSNYDYIWCGHIYLLPIGFMLKRIFRCKYFTICHGGETRVYGDNPIIKRFFKKIICDADIVICNSHKTFQEISSVFGRRRNIFIVNPGVDTKYFKPLSNVEKDGVEILSVGTLVKRKNHENVIKSLPALIESFPRLKYVIIGEGPEKERLMKLAYEYMGLKNHVVFLGYIEDNELVKYYNKAKIFIMPSKDLEERLGTEGFGIVYLEANACELPVIGGRAGGVEDAIIDGETGILVDPESVVDIKDAIEKLLKEENLANSLGKKGRERVIAELDWDVVAKRFFALLVNQD